MSLKIHPLLKVTVPFLYMARMHSQEPLHRLLSYSQARRSLLSSQAPVLNREQLQGLHQDGQSFPLMQKQQSSYPCMMNWYSFRLLPAGQVCPLILSEGQHCQGNEVLQPLALSCLNPIPQPRHKRYLDQPPIGSMTSPSSVPLRMPLLPHHSGK